MGKTKLKPDVNSILAPDTPDPIMEAREGAIRLHAAMLGMGSGSDAVADFDAYPDAGGRFRVLVRAPRGKGTPYSEIVAERAGMPEEARISLRNGQETYYVGATGVAAYIPISKKNALPWARTLYRNALTRELDSLAQQWKRLLGKYHGQLRVQADARDEELYRRTRGTRFLRVRVQAGMRGWMSRQAQKASLTNPYGTYCEVTGMAGSGNPIVGWIAVTVDAPASTDALKRISGSLRRDQMPGKPGFHARTRELVRTAVLSIRSNPNHSRAYKLRSDPEAEALPSQDLPIVLKRWTYTRLQNAKADGVDVFEDTRSLTADPATGFLVFTRARTDTGDGQVNETRFRNENEAYAAFNDLAVEPDTPTPWAVAAEFDLKKNEREAVLERMKAIRMKTDSEVLGGGAFGTERELNFG